METLLFGGSAERLGRERLQVLERAAAPLSVVVTDDRDEMDGHLPDTVVAVREVPVDLLARAPSLRWYQHWYAGVEHIVEALAGKDVVVTNACGVHAEPMTEHVFGMLLALARQLHRSIRNQLVKEWPPLQAHAVWELAEKSLLVVGYGSIGRRVGELAGAFDMRVSGVRRQPRGDEPVPVFGMGQLGDLLASADIVVCLLPLTPDTHRVFDEEMFARMKPGAVFVNAGRGGLVDEAALVANLENGHLGAAALDVTDPEPLPEDSSLWQMENVIISPHMGGITPEYGRRIWEIVLDNLGRYHAGRNLRNVIDMSVGY